MPQQSRELSMLSMLSKVDSAGSFLSGPFYHNCEEDVIKTQMRESRLEAGLIQKFFLFPEVAKTHGRNMRRKHYRPANIQGKTNRV